MNLTEGVAYVLFAAISLLSAAAAVVLTGYLQRAAARARPGTMPVPLTADTDPFGCDTAFDLPRVYEFRDGHLLSGTERDDAFLGSGTDPANAFATLTEALSVLHPDLPARMTALFRRGQAFFLVGYLGPDALAVAGRVLQDRLSVTVTPADETGGRRMVDVRALDALQEEAEALRRALKLSAAVQWKETDDHRVIWANPPYLDLAAQVTGRSGDEVGWPLPALFGDQLVPNPAEGSLRRCSVALPDRTRPLWFEVAAMPLGDGTVYYSARPVDRLVDAEAALREFVQTLSKTFASLPIGLAVFDRRRELVMFNPALVALSMLEPGYLSQRPTLRAFLDQLRERRRMPEPRDYHSWREDIARLEEGAEKGTYHELWTLPGGESLRVTGRPHPDGAVAFMFEDISHEMSVTRRFRADLDLDRSVLDDMAAAFAVFDREGRVLRTNAAYNAMWRANGSGPATSLIEATRRWEAAFEPTGLWGDIRQFAQHETDRAAWSESVIARSGGEALCRVAPLKGGHTIVWFLSSDAGHDDPLSAWLPDRGPARTDLEPAGPVASGRGEGAA